MELQPRMMPRQCQQIAVAGHQPPGLRRCGEFEEFLVVGISTARQRSRALKVHFSGNGATLSEAGGLLFGIEGPPLQLIGEHAYQFILACSIDDNFGKTRSDGGLQRSNIRFPEDQPVQPDVGIQNQPHAGYPGAVARGFSDFHVEVA